MSYILSLSFPPTHILSYTFLSSHTQPFIYPYQPFLPHSSFHILILSFPLALILSYNFLSSQIQPFYIYPYLPFIPHSFFQIPSFPPTATVILEYTFFPPHTLIQPFLTSSSFSSSHNHPTFPNPILFSFH